MAKEIERKFLPREVPSSAEGADSVEIQQGYLAIDKDAEVRVRRAGADRMLTVKGGRGEVRDEIEIAIDEEQFGALWPLTEARRLEKRRPDWIGDEVTGDERYFGRSLAERGAPDRDRSDTDTSGPSRSYRLKRKEEPADGIRRVAAGRTEKALEELRAFGNGEDPAGAVHSARKDLKKIRSVLRLVRAEIGEKRYRIENTRYRDAGTRLSASRDAQVKVDTLAALRERFEAELPGEAADEWTRLLSDERRELDRDSSLAAQVEAAIAEIEAGRDEIGSWSLSTGSWDLLSPGIERSYRRGRREMKRVRAGRGAEDVHSWRKRVKDLWYQLRIVRKTWPAVIGEMADQAHDLSDELGDHHDLALLREDLGRRSEVSEAKELSAAIKRRQDEILDDALRLGTLLYAEKPKALLRRLSVYWESWRN